MLRLEMGITYMNTTNGKVFPMMNSPMPANINKKPPKKTDAVVVATPNPPDPRQATALRQQVRFVQALARETH